MCCLSFFRANKIDQVGIGLEHLAYLDGPRLSVHLGVIYRDLDFQTPEVHPPEALRDSPNPAVIQSAARSHDPAARSRRRNKPGPLWFPEILRWRFAWRLRCTSGLRSTWLECRKTGPVLPHPGDVIRCSPDTGICRNRQRCKWVPDNVFSHLVAFPSKETARF